MVNMVATRIGTMEVSNQAGGAPDFTVWIMITDPATTVISIRIMESVLGITHQLVHIVILSLDLPRGGVSVVVLASLY